MSTCPKCSLLSPDSAIYCDCGHSFNDGAASSAWAAGYRLPAPVRRAAGTGTKIAVGIFGYILGNAGWFVFSVVFGQLRAQPLGPLAGIAGVAFALWLLGRRTATGASPLPPSVAGAEPGTLGVMSPFSEPAAPARDLPGRKANYFVRHWRGELPLALSYWVNGFLASVAASLFAQSFGGWIVNVPGVANYRSLLLIASFWVVVAALNTWQTVGVWRSANRPRKDGRFSPWASAAKLSVALGVVRCGMLFVTDGMPAFREAVDQGRWLERNAKWTIRPLRDGTELEVSGGIGWGFADDFERALDARPAARVVHLNLGVGGLVQEGKRARDIVSARSLTTYVSDSCVSACTLVFMGGRRRILLAGAALGFHAPIGVGSHSAGWRTLLDTERQYMAAIGMPPAFVAHVLATPPETMWYPTVDELIDAGVVTEVSDGAAFAPSGRRFDERVTHGEPAVEGASKQGTFLSLLAVGRATLHIDARRPGVIVPVGLRSERDLVLEYGRDMPTPIPDLEVDEQGVRATLSFSRRSYRTRIPWSAVYAIVSGEKGVTLYRADVPSDVDVAGPGGHGGSRVGARDTAAPEIMRPNR